MLPCYDLLITEMDHPDFLECLKNFNGNFSHYVFAGKAHTVRP